MGTDRPSTFPGTIRRALLDRQRALFHGVDEIEDDLRTVEESRDAEVEAQAQEEARGRLAERIGEHDREELTAIQRALAKIPVGAYGLCEHCRRPIPVERLVAIPAARYCLDCKREAEAEADTAGSFEPRARRIVPPELRDLGDDEVVEAIRERLDEHGDPDLLAVGIRYHAGVVGLTGEVPSEPQRQVLVQLITDTLGLEVVDRLRVAVFDRETDDARRPVEPSDAVPVEERIPSGQGMRPLADERWTPPEDEGEPAETAPDEPVPEEEK